MDLTNENRNFLRADRSVVPVKISRCGISRVCVAPEAPSSCLWLLPVVPALPVAPVLPVAPPCGPCPPRGPSLWPPWLYPPCGPSKSPNYPVAPVALLGATTWPFIPGYIISSCYFTLPLVNALDYNYSSWTGG